MKLAFYAPMKSPDHPVPSGDRRMGRLLWQALELAGFEPELTSSLRSFDGRGDPALQKSIAEKGKEEADNLIAKWRENPVDAPKGWFTYHLYHKAPDWIGPTVCRALDIPYFVAEASHAPKRASGLWQLGYDAAASGIASARLVFHMTALDGACLRPLVSQPERLVFLPPFLDIEGFLQAAVPVDVETEIVKAGGKTGMTNLLAVAMMRSGDKMISYEQLGESLRRLKGGDWQLLVVGEGDQRARVEQALAPQGAQVAYLGPRPAEQLPAFYGFADLYVWPAHGEAYGMAFLEAQACGLPVVAGNIRGVPDVVKDGVTGILTPEGDKAAFAAAIGNLLQNPEERKRMGAAARDYVMAAHDLATAAALLKEHIGAAL
ncbi:MAG: glycosyltransferase family 4 protein [Sneathiella sp.]|nr:glycosyltransferase family 4 protein [Sneathiella sp.]